MSKGGAMMRRSVIMLQIVRTQVIGAEWKEEHSGASLKEQTMLKNA